MLCLNCSKLSFNNSGSRKCVRCQGMILNNLAVICDACSNSEKLCSICLKKMISQNVRSRPKSNCSGCGK